MGAFLQPLPGLRMNRNRDFISYKRQDLLALSTWRNECGEGGVRGSLPSLTPPRDEISSQQDLSGLKGRQRVGGEQWDSGMGVGILGGQRAETSKEQRERGMNWNGAKYLPGKKQTHP